MASVAPVVALIDMDCFYVQVHQRLDPSTRDAPAVVVQYNQWRGGCILSVNYEARNLGVSRAMRGDDARAACPEIHIFQVPEDRGKADLTKYREASAEVFDVICNFSDLIVVEKASVDEAYLDLTKLIETYIEMPSLDSICETHLPECSSCDEQSLDTYNCCFKHFYNYFANENEADDLLNEEKRFIIASKIVKDIRDAIFERTQFRCSAGISYSKTLAKLCCSMKKPNGQTVVPPFAVSTVLATTPVRKVRSLGGKFGEEVKSKLGIEYIGDIKKFSLSELSEHFGSKNANWLASIANGFDGEEVVSRLIAKSVGCSKQFPMVSKNALKTKSDVAAWLSKLVEELVERLNKDMNANLRIAKLVSVTIRFANNENVTRSIPLRCYDAKVITNDLMRNIVAKVLLNMNGETETLKEPVTLLGLSSSKFVDSILESRNLKMDSFYEKVDKPIIFNEKQPNDVSVSCNSSAVVAEEDDVEFELPPPKRGFFYRKTLELMGEMHEFDL